jgi:hypothetical protein
MILILMLLAQFAGIFGHWLNRWKQGRTSSTFGEYMAGNRFESLQSLMASLASVLTVWSTNPELHFDHSLALILVGLYTAGFAFDSKFNRDPNPSIPEEDEGTVQVTEQVNTKGKKIIYETKEPSRVNKSLKSKLDDDGTF